MPDGDTSGYPSRRLQTAISDVQTHLNALPGGCRVLTADELRRYREKDILCGWSLDVHLCDKPIRLNVLIDNRFPRSQARIALADPPAPLSMAHVEDDGILCLLPAPSTVDHTAPVKAVQELLRLACDLIEGSGQESEEQDFRDEFLSYWVRDSHKDAPVIQSLLSLEGPSRLVKVWLGRDRCVVANGQDEIIHWLGNLLQDRESKTRECVDALLLWLERPLVPREYPRSASALRDLARKNGAEALLEQLAANEELLWIVVVLGAPTANGPCLGGIAIYPPKRTSFPGGRATNRMTAGFRPGKVPRVLQVARYLSGAQIARTNVFRVDSSWVHGRDQDKQHAICRDARVAIIGCGSIGGGVVSLLAKSGVGSLFIVDPDRLAWSNIGRHVLGADSIGKYKAEALADDIRAHLPHLRSVEARPHAWEELGEEDLAKIASMDLVVSTMGSWPAEGMLNEWHLAHGRSFPLVYGWTEPYAVAGHAVAIHPQGGCLQCGFDVTGRCTTRVVDWHDSPPNKQEPACGGHFQPYGPIEAENVVALIAELCLDCLVKDVSVSSHRIWAARKALVDRAGGAWALEWTEMVNGRNDGAILHERLWPASEACPECGEPKK